MEEVMSFSEMRETLDSINFSFFEGVEDPKMLASRESELRDAAEKLLKALTKIKDHDPDISELALDKVNSAIHTIVRNSDARLLKKDAKLKDKEERKEKHEEAKAKEKEDRKAAKELGKEAKREYKEKLRALKRA